MLTRLIVFTAIAINACAIAQTKPTTQPRGDTLVVSAVIDAPADEIFECFKTSDGIVKAWGVAQARNDFRVGGQIRTAYAKDIDLDSPKAIANTILAYVPGRMLAIKPTAPEGAPDWLVAICDAGWNVITLEPMDLQRTRVTITGMGYAAGPLFDKAYSFFKQGNESTLKHMQQVLGHADLKAQSERIWAQLKSRAGGDWIAEKTGTNGAIFRARSRWESSLDGLTLIGRGWTGDASGMHAHAVMLAWLDPISGAPQFEQIFEGGPASRGSFMALGENAVVMPLMVESAPGKPAGEFYAVMRFINNDTYHFNVYTSRKDAMEGKVSNATVDLEYRRVSDAPEAFRNIKQ